MERRLITIGGASAIAAGSLSLLGFVLQLVAPRDDLERATDPLWLAAHAAELAMTVLCLLYVVGLRAASAQRLTVAGDMCFALCIVGLALLVGFRTRFLATYAAARIDDAFARDFVTNEYGPGLIAFVVLLGTLLVGWIGFTLLAGRAARFGVPLRIALVVTVLLLPWLPIVPGVPILVAGWVLLRRARDATARPNPELLVR